MKHLPLPAITGVYKRQRHGVVSSTPSMFHLQSGDFQIVVWENGTVVLSPLNPNKWVMGDKPIHQGNDAVKFASELSKKVGRFGDPIREDILRNMVWRYSR